MSHFICCWLNCCSSLVDCVIIVSVGDLAVVVIGCFVIVHSGAVVGTFVATTIH